MSGVGDMPLTVTGHGHKPLDAQSTHCGRDRHACRGRIQELGLLDQLVLVCPSAIAARQGVGHDAARLELLHALTAMQLGNIETGLGNNGREHRKGNTSTHLNSMATHFQTSLTIRFTV